MMVINGTNATENIGIGMCGRHVYKFSPWLLPRFLWKGRSWTLRNLSSQGRRVWQSFPFSQIIHIFKIYHSEFVVPVLVVTPSSPRFSRVILSQASKRTRSWKLELELRSSSMKTSPGSGQPPIGNSPIMQALVHTRLNLTTLCNAAPSRIEVARIQCRYVCQ